MEVRRRGRPKGAKDSKPRQFRSRSAVPVNENGDVLLSVEQQIRQLKRPQRLPLLAEICGLSVGTLRKKIAQGKIKAFGRSGMTLVEPADFLEYWLGGRA